MVKRITFSISDELHNKIQQIKNGFRKRNSISKICQNAIEKELDDAIRRNAIYKDGIQYGHAYVGTLSSDECIKAKDMVDSFPRNYPEEIIDIFMKADLINQDSLQKHFEILDMWKDKDLWETCVYERVREIKEIGSPGDWDEWLGTPPSHEGVEIYETHITGEPVELITPDGKKKTFVSRKSAADIRHEAMRNLWREGLIAGIKDATKSIQETGNEND